MLRIASLSLFMGVVILASGSFISDRVSEKTDNNPGASWSSSTMRVVKGLPLQAKSEVAVQLDANGQAIIEVDVRQAPLEDLPLLHLRFREQPEVMAMIVSWRAQAGGGRLQYRRIETPPGESFWLDMEGVRGWNSPASTLGVVFLGPPGGKLTLESMEILPSGFPRSLYAMLGDWRAFIPWQHSSINTHIGVRSQDTPLPVPVIVSVLFASIAVFVLCVVVFRRRLDFQWSVVGTIFALCWLGLDLFWQARLLSQAGLTTETYAGKTTAEKRLLGRDRDLYALILSAHEVMGSSTARVLVHSSSDYQGMRGAYYLYPQNVFWKRHAKTLPAPQYIRPGDYVLLLQPSPVVYNAVGNYLSYGDETRIKVDRLLSSDTGSLYKVI